MTTPEPPGIPGAETDTLGRTFLRGPAINRRYGWNSRNRIAYWTRAKGLPAIKTGGQWRLYLTPELRTWEKATGFDCPWPADTAFALAA